jgi:hypothetical protein
MDSESLKIRIILIHITDARRGDYTIKSFSLPPTISHHFLTNSRVWGVLMSALQRLKTPGSVSVTASIRPTMSIGRKAHSAAVFLRNLRTLDVQFSELRKVRKRLQIAEMRAAGRKRRYVSPTRQQARAPIGVSLTRRR